jgi:carboxyl-terminal processing protease
MTQRKPPLLLALVALLASCGDGGSGSGGVAVTPTPAPTPAPTPSPTPTPAPTVAGCSVRERQDWTLARLNEWYLFPSLLASGVNPASYGDVQGYIDALVAPARAQSRDRFFTYITSIAEENAFFSSGQSAGFGIRLSYDSANRRLFVTEAFEGAPALAAGIDRGAEITAIGTSAANLQTVSSLFASGGSQAVANALGPSTPGTTRVLRLVAGGTTREVSVTKADFALTPVSSRYGARILIDGPKKVGYVNLRTFIDTADPALRTAFADFKAQGVSELIIDLRYNGGGLVSIADLLGDLIGGGRAGQVFSYTTFRPERAAQNNDQKNFANQPQTIAPTRIAWIGTGATASASELVMNSMRPYLGTSQALVGSNTFGKPVGQVALDRSLCDDRLRVVAFRSENANRQGDYYTGLASVMERSCAAGDDFNKPLGDPEEASVKAALDFLASRSSCTPLTASTEVVRQVQAAADWRELLMPDTPTPAQRETPGLF